MSEEFNSSHVSINTTLLKQNSNKKKQPKHNRLVETSIAI